jgi:hypothetical protein
MPTTQTYQAVYDATIESGVYWFNLGETAVVLSPDAYLASLGAGWSQQSVTPSGPPWVSGTAYTFTFVYTAPVIVPPGYGQQWEIIGGLCLPKWCQTRCEQPIPFQLVCGCIPTYPSQWGIVGPPEEIEFTLPANMLAGITPNVSCTGAVIYNTPCGSPFQPGGCQWLSTGPTFTLQRCDLFVNQPGNPTSGVLGICTTGNQCSWGYEGFLCNVSGVDTLVNPISSPAYVTILAYVSSYSVQGSDGTSSIYCCWVVEFNIVMTAAAIGSPPSPFLLTAIFVSPYEPYEGTGGSFGHGYTTGVVCYCETSPNYVGLQTTPWNAAAPWCPPRAANWPQPIGIMAALNNDLFACSCTGPPPYNATTYWNQGVCWFNDNGPYEPVSYTGKLSW